MVRLTVKEKDAWWTVAVVDPVAAALLHPLLRVRSITPHHVSAGSLLLAIAAGLGFATGHLVVGALLFQASFLLDCMDGKLAHTRGEVAEWGKWIDSVVDALRFATCYAGLAWTVASPGEVERADIVAAAIYPALSYAVVFTGSAWPHRSPAKSLTLDASPLVFVRAIPRRLGAPMSTVDGEAVVFTIGPLLGRPILGIWVGVALNLVHLAVAVATRTRLLVRERARSSGALPDADPTREGEHTID